MAGNTAPIHGKVARIMDNATAIAFTDGWTLNFTIDMAETTAQGDNWKKYAVGTEGVTGSFSGSFVAGNTEQAVILALFSGANPHNSGVEITDMKFAMEDSGDYWAGDLFVTSYSMQAPVGGIVKFTVNFTGHDTWTLTTA